MSPPSIAPSHHLSQPVAVILGYGPAVGDTVLRALLKVGFTVAIVARSGPRLKAATGVLFT